jgi:OmpA-OmpF porin, OOP family
MNILCKKTGIAAAVAVLGLTASLGAHAQSTSYVAPAAGSYHPSWYLLPSVNAIDPDSRFGVSEYGGGFGLRLGKPIAPMWDVQAGTTYSRAWDQGNSIRRNTLGADLLFMFSREQFRPFILAGGGVEYNKGVKDGRRANDTSPFLNVGVGMQYSFDQQWGMQADVRRTYSYISSNHFGFNHAGNNIVTVGLSYAFDKPAAPRPMAVAEPAPAPMVVAPAPQPVRAEPVARVEPAPAPPPAPVPRFERFTLTSTELFGFNSSQLQGSQPKLDEVAAVLNRNPQAGEVAITGYTDRLGATKYNQELSQRRADEVKGYLISKGVPANRISSVGKGESNPVVECKDRQRSALIRCLEPNRRVEMEDIVIERRVQ